MDNRFNKLPIEKLNELTYATRGAAFKVNTKLGPGLLESVYKACLIEELHQRGLLVESEVPIPVSYNDKIINKQLKIDLLVEKALIIEVKAVEQLSSLHHAQTLTYLKLSGLKLGLLINFNTTNINKSIIRVIN
jgi:GxxExxY protein